MIDFFQLREKAVSQAQQKMMGMALAYKRGEMDDASPEVKKMADSMSMKDLEDFAKTKHKGLPVKKEEVELSERYEVVTVKHLDDAGEDKALSYGRKKGYKEAGVIGDSPIKAMVLFHLKSSDKKDLKGANVKAGEQVFRYATRSTVAGDIFPLIKVNLNKGIVYYLTQESSSGEIDEVKFETRGAKLKFARMMSGVVEEVEQVDEATKVPAGMKFIASYVYKGGDGKDHTHTHLRKGTKMTDPVVVHIDGKEWKTFQSFTKAKQSAIDHIKGIKGPSKFRKEEQDPLLADENPVTENGQDFFQLREKLSEQVLAHGGKGQYKAVKKGGVVHIMYKGKKVGTADYDSGADAFFASIKGVKGQKDFDTAQDMVDYFAKKKITEHISHEII
jgi:hypothetical protein